MVEEVAEQTHLSAEAGSVEKPAAASVSLPES
jgi:hypothetical protein